MGKTANKLYARWVMNRCAITDLNYILSIY